MEKLEVKVNGAIFCIALSLVFVVLKVSGVIDWSWVWVLSPIWISMIIGIVLFVILLVFVFLSRRN